jgi:hypothetical protein
MVGERRQSITPGDRRPLGAGRRHDPLFPLAAPPLPVAGRDAIPSGLGWRHDTYSIASHVAPLRLVAGESPSLSVAVTPDGDGHPAVAVGA